MIRAREVRVIDAEGKQLGILPTPEALKIAEDAGLDLVEIASQAKPPVCRVMDFGKYKYQLSKKTKEARKKQTVIHVKEVKFRPRTEEHDFQFKVRNIKRFLEEGDKVKVFVTFRGREITHAELGREMLGRVVETLKDVATVEQPPKLEGKNMTLLVAPQAQK